MPEQLAHCPLCRNNKFKHFDTGHFQNSLVQNQICTQCGFVFQNPRMSAEELNGFYTNSYREVYQGQADPTEKDMIVQRLRAEHLLNFLVDMIPQISTHLDIGSSAGMLLATIQKAYHCTSMGIEPGEAYRKFTQDKGFDVYPDLANIQNGIIEQFDLISMIHVLEHIPNPIPYLNEIRRDHLSREGYLLLEVPNLYFHDSFEIAHMSAFSRHSLEQMLITSGYSIVHSMAHGFPRSKLIPLYLTFLAQPMETVPNKKVKPELWVKQKRRLGFIYRRLVQKFFPSLSWKSFNNKE